MAELVQLQEKGVNKYMMTTVKGVQGLSEKIDAKTYAPTYTTGFQDYPSGQKLQITVTGKQAVITGAFTNTSQIAAGASVQIGTMPDGCKPNTLTISPRLQGTGSSTYIIKIETTGAVTLERYKYGTTDNQVDVNSWLTVNMSYIIQ